MDQTEINFERVSPKIEIVDQDCECIESCECKRGNCGCDFIKFKNENQLDQLCVILRKEADNIEESQDKEKILRHIFCLKKLMDCYTFSQE